MRRAAATLLVAAVLALFPALPAHGKTIRVGIYNFSPLCDLQQFESDEPVVSGGLYVALLREVAAREKWDIEFFPGSLSECWQRLGNAEIDLLPAAVYSRELANAYDFSRETVISTWAQVYAADKSRVQSWLDLASKSIGVVKDDPYTQELRAILKRFDIQCKFIEFRNYMDVFKALENRWVDAGVVDRLYAVTHEKGFHFEKTPILFSPIELRFAVPKDRNSQLIAALDYHLGLLKKDPGSLYHQLLNEVTGYREDTRTREIMAWALLGTLAVAGLLVGMSLILRRQVRKKTAELSANYEELKKEILMRRSAESALRETQERFRALFEFAPEPIFLISTEGDIEDCNEAASEMTGYAKRELLGMKVSDLVIVGPAQAEGITASGIMVGDHHEEIQCRRAGGETFPAQISTRALELGDQRGILLIVRDLTEQKIVEQELIRNQKLESIGILAGGIAHDFNNLLGAILGNVSLAKMRLGPEDKSFKRLEVAEQACMRAKELIYQLLTFSRGGAPVREAASVLTIIEESCRFSLRGSNVGCEFETAGDLWAAEIDVGQISQVVNNIVINADQAMTDGGTILVKAENKVVDRGCDLPVAPGNYIKISITDNGTGIPRINLPRVFDPYFTTKSTGNGLGLATCYSIIKRHGGHISVQSEIGVGTTFHIYLPASDRVISAGREICATPMNGRGKVLVMDDDDNVRETLEEMLKELSYEVKSVKDGAEAVRLYKETGQTGEKFDLVIMDLTIPGGIGGREAIVRLKEIDPAVKAIVSSGYSNDPVMSEYREHGFSGVIVKPYRVQELGEVVHKVLRGNGVSKGLHGSA